MFLLYHYLSVFCLYFILIQVTAPSVPYLERPRPLSRINRPLPLPIPLGQVRRPRPLGEILPPTIGIGGQIVDYAHRKTRAQVRCIGRRFHSKALRLPTNPEQRRRFTRPPQELCPKTHYGGNEDFNLGAYCRYDIEGAGGGPLVVFDQDQVTLENHEIVASAAKLALLTYCQYQCRCVEDPARRPGNNRFPAQEIIDFESDPESHWDLNPITTSGIYTAMMNRPITEQYYLHIPEESWYPDIPRLALFFNGEELYRKPHCRNIMPTWQLPHPFTNIPPDWQLIDLCGSIVTGGNRKGNAGGVCLKSNENRDSIVFESYLGHPALSYKNFPLGTALHAWCLRYCTCDPDKDVNMLDKERIVLRSDDSLKLIINFPNGGVRIADATVGGGMSDISLLFGASSRAGSQSNGRSCDLDSPWSCSTVYPKLFPPGVQSAQWLLEDGTFGGTETTEGEVLAPTCKLQCTSQADCGYPSPTCGVCRAFLSESEKQAAGLGPWLPNTFNSACRALPLILKSRIGGRANRETSEDWGCPCNSSYVSHACCFQAEGIIWEPPEMKLGTLKDMDT